MPHHLFFDYLFPKPLDRRLDELGRVFGVPRRPFFRS
jgi:hypothetical protein